MPDTSTWLVETKLRPPHLRGETLRRPHLEEALTHSVSTMPLTLLSAPAGYGKTTMLAALPHLLPGLPLAWVTLETEDGDPSRFIGLLAAACRRLHPDFGRSVWPWLTAGSADSTALKRAVGALVTEIMALLPEPFILVLDDLHFITEPAVFVALEYLLEHQPPQMHIAVGTRHDPPLRLARLAARRQLGELRRPDLGFRPEETQQLLGAVLGLSLAAQEVAALHDRTEGWPAGLCLLASPLARPGAASADRTQFLSAIHRSERYAFDFLAEEVLRSVPADLYRFLLETSVLPEMTPTLCQAVTGREDAADLLDELYRQNLTIAALSHDAAGEPVYRHHALLARLLSRQLEREMPGAVADLQRRAARAQKTPGRAIAHYLSAGLWDEAAQLMIQFGLTLLHFGMSETLRTWYGALPPATQAHPRLTILMGACELHRGDYAAADLLFRQSAEAFARAGDGNGQSEALTASITSAFQNGDRAAAADLVARAEPLPLSPMGRIRVLLSRAWLHLWACEWADVARAVGEGLAIPRITGVRQADLVGITFMGATLAAVPGCLDVVERYCAEAGALAPPQTAWRLGAMELGTWPLIWRGKVDEALAQARAAEEIRQRMGGYPFVGNDLPAQLATLQIARGDLEGAGRSVEMLLQRAETAPKTKSSFYLHAAGRSLALLGRLAEAQALHLRLTTLRDGLPLTPYLCDHLAGLIALLQGRGPDAAAALHRAGRLEGELPIAWVGGSARLLQARLLLEQGRQDEALAMASRVVSGWEQAGTPGCALLDGPAILPVLLLAAQRGDQAAARVAALLPEAAAAQAAPTGVHTQAALAALPEPLTQRECDVLRLVVAGRSNREIGETLYITSETVKTHVAHILRKLDVASRTQAAIRGRELGF